MRPKLMALRCCAGSAPDLAPCRKFPRPWPDASCLGERPPAASSPLMSHNARPPEIIGAHQLAAPARDEGVTNTSAGIDFTGVLQVGIRAEKPTRGCHGLVEARMHGPSVPEAWGTSWWLELRKLTVTQNPGGRRGAARVSRTSTSVEKPFCFSTVGNPNVEEHHGGCLGS